MLGLLKKLFLWVKTQNLPKYSVKMKHLGRSNDTLINPLSLKIQEGSIFQAANLLLVSRVTAVRAQDLIVKDLWLYCTCRRNSPG